MNPDEQPPQPPQKVCFSCGLKAAKYSKTYMQDPFPLVWELGNCDNCGKDESVAEVKFFGNPKFKPKRK